MERIDAIELVRAIRDSQYRETKDMTKEEYLAYIRDAGSKAMEVIRRKLRDQKKAA